MKYPRFIVKVTRRADRAGGPQAHKLSLWAVVLGGILAVSALGLYIRTLAPTVLYYDPAFFDSANLQVMVNVLGIPSYTGYPSYVLLAKPFTYLPFGDPAYRVNLASAIYAAFTVLLVYLAGLKLTGRVLTSAVGAAVLALGESFWSQAIITEVYTLNAFFLALVFYLLLIWRERRSDVYLLSAVFLCGLSLGNHLTSGLLCLAVPAFVILTDRGRLRDADLLLRSLGLFMIGLGSYLYLPLRAMMGAPLSNEDPSTLGGLVSLITGAGFQDRMLVFGPAELPGRLSLVAEYLPGHAGPLFWILGLAGAGWMLRRDRASLAVLSILFLGNLFYAIEYDIEDVFIYFIPSCLALGVWTACGLGLAQQMIKALFQTTWRTAGILSIAVPAVAMTILLTGVPATYRSVDRGDDYRGREILEAVAGSAKPNSTILYHGATLQYMILVEGRRTDLEQQDPFYTDDWVQRADTALDEGPVYILFPGKTNMRKFKDAGYSLVPVRQDWLYEIVPR